MSNNAILNNARYSADTDEWYTPYEIIEEELCNYANEFRNKVVLCNCDDPFESNFAYFFMRNFNKFGIKKLICTSYSESRIGTIKGKVKLPFILKNKNKKNDKKTGYVLVIKTMPGKNNDVVQDGIIAKKIQESGIIKNLKGNGDFRTKECLEYLKQCDICCTNPPFSLFSELFSLLVKYKKQFLLIGNQNAITYKEIFPYIKEEKVWVGYKFGDMAFRVPQDSEPRKTRFWIDKEGQKWRSIGNAMWLTNLDIPKRHQILKLTQYYSKNKYHKYDNFDAINVPRVADIPMDYHGIMGVPITFLKYHNGNQFEIVGEANHGSDNEFDLFKPIVGGKELFKRILIKRKCNKVKKRMKFKMLDLFCGAGGFSYGMHKNKCFNTVVAVDFDEKATETFKKNMPNTKVIVGDITHKDIKDKIIREAKKSGVNMIIGGPPCQGYSTKGKKLGLNDPRNFLFREYLNIVQQLQPKIFIIENVKGLLLSTNGWFKDEILKSIKKIGYKVNYDVLNAADFGVPQARERAVFICSKDKTIELPGPTVHKHTTVRQAIGDLAYLNSGEGEFEARYITKALSKYQRLMRRESKKLYNHKASNHKQVAIEKLKLIPPEQGKEALPASMRGNQQFKTTWGRLKWNAVSPTIDTRFDASSNGTNNHPFLHRAITPREAARIQSFDDKFVFYGSKVYIRKQIGNAVPPLMAEAIANKIDADYNNGGTKQ